jgi:hypothetical protein
MFSSDAMTDTITYICKTISEYDTSINKGEEELLGYTLSQLIVDYAKEKIILDSFRAKYKPVAQKKTPVAVSILIMKQTPYKPLPLPTLPKFPFHLPLLCEFPYTERLSKERVRIILKNMPKNFLSNDQGCPQVICKSGKKRFLRYFRLQVKI